LTVFSFKPSHPDEARFKQRKEVADAVKKHGTILELNAGEGNISEKMYKGLGKRYILVDKDEVALKKAGSKSQRIRLKRLRN
jgi:hypothetical protein